MGDKSTETPTGDWFDRHHTATYIIVGSVLGTIVIACLWINYRGINRSIIPRCGGRRQAPNEAKTTGVAISQPGLWERGHGNPGINSGAYLTDLRRMEDGRRAMEMEKGSSEEAEVTIGNTTQSLSVPSATPSISEISTAGRGVYHTMRNQQFEIVNPPLPSPSQRQFEQAQAVAPKGTEKKPVGPRVLRKPVPSNHPSRPNLNKRDTVSSFAHSPSLYPSSVISRVSSPPAVLPTVNNPSQ